MKAEVEFVKAILPTPSSWQAWPVQRNEPQGMAHLEPFPLGSGLKDMTSQRTLVWQK